jgi:hypothetical protein
VILLVALLCALLSIALFTLALMLLFIAAGTEDKK